MPKTLSGCLFAVFVQLLSCSAQGDSEVRLNVDWGKFLAKHDLIWDRMPDDYYEGAFVGNGLFGAIIFKDDIKPKGYLLGYYTTIPGGVILAE